MKKYFALCIVFALLIFLFSGCSSTKETVPENMDEGIVLRTSLPEAEWEGYSDALNTMYLKENPEISQIKWDLVDRSIYEDYLKVNLAAQNMPDIISIGNSISVSQWSEQVIPFTEEDVKDLDPFLKGILKKDESGQIIGIPILLEANGMLYDTDLMRKCGVNEIPKSEDQFQEFCLNILNAGVKPLINHYKEALLSSSPYTSFFALNDNLERDDWYDLADFLDLTIEYGNMNSLSTEREIARNYFYIGKYAALNNEGSWIIPAIRKNVPLLENDLVLGPTPFQRVPLKNKLNLSYLTLSVTQSCQYPAEAKKFILWLASSEMAENYFEQVMGCLTTKNLSNPSFRQLSPIATEMKKAYQTNPMVETDPLYSSDIMNKLSKLWSQYLVGEIEKDDVVTKTCQLLNDTHNNLMKEE